MSETFKLKHALEEKVLEKFAPVCKKIAEIERGDYEVKKKFDYIMCIPYQESPVLSPEQIELFYKFTRENKKLLEELKREKDREVGVWAEVKLIGGFSEHTLITYNPAKDNYEVSVVLYSQHTARGIPKDEPIQRIERVGGLTYDVWGDIQWNEAMDGYAGYGHVIVEVPASLEKLKEAVNKATELAEAVAEEALEKLLEPEE